MNLCLTAALALGFGAVAGACAGSRTASNPCLDRCTAAAGSSLERSTCELECSQTASAPTSPAPAQPAQASAQDPGAATPVAQSGPPAAQPARTYPGSTAPRTAPGGSSPPTGTSPSSQPAVLPSQPPLPTMAELVQRRGVCESQCDSEGSNSDRATCRLQCAQITNRPTAQPGQTGTPTYVSPPATQPGQSGGLRPTPTDPQVLAACQAGCDDPSIPTTDRATCRLNCSAVGQVGPAPSSYYVLGGSPPSDADQRAAVIRSSNGAQPGPTPGQVANPQKVAQCAAQAQTCASNCAGLQAPCNQTCDQGKMSATDRATCKLTCESNVDVCRDDCRIKEGTCRGPSTKP